MVTASQMCGSVMAIQIVLMDLMNTMAACPRLVLYLNFAVTMETVSPKAGCAMGTMTAGTWVMRRTVLLNPSTVSVGSGSVLAITSVWIWVHYVITSLIAPMGQMSPHFAVSCLTTVSCPCIHFEQYSSVYHHCHYYCVAVLGRDFSFSLSSHLCSNHNWIQIIFTG